MSSSTYTVLRCDRCGHETEIRQEADKAGWAMLSAREVTGLERPRFIGGGYGELAADLCPTCADRLFDWWANPEPRAEPVEPPPVEPAAPPRRFTIADRSAAIAEAKDLLRAQAEQALAAAREEPTSILDERTLPASLHGLDERARELVDLIVSRALTAPLRALEVVE